jgi:hypothetical protein
MQYIGNICGLQSSLLVALLVLGQPHLKIAKPSALDQTTWQTTHYVRDGSGKMVATDTKNYV